MRLLKFMGRDHIPRHIVDVHIVALFPVATGTNITVTGGPFFEVKETVAQIEKLMFPAPGSPKK